MDRKRPGFGLIALALGALVAAAQPSLAEAPGAPRRGRPRPSLWEPQDPVASLDFRHGAGGSEGVPRPPFRFVKEERKGSTPKVLVKDAGGRTWSAKWGEEARPEVFASRLVWAAGYFAVPTHFVAHGRIARVRGLKKAARHVSPDGEFHDARFQLRDRRLKLLGDEESWAWNDNPFTGTKELNGLKILLMLLSNWDSKDLRDEDRGSNTGIFLDARRPGFERYAFYDWGASMGRWGNVLGRSKWDCQGYADQTHDFVEGLHSDGTIHWGYSGQRTEDITRNIGLDDVRWFLRGAGSVTDAQLRAGLAAAGGSAEEIECFTHAIRDRLDQLHALVLSRR